MSAQAGESGTSVFSSLMVLPTASSETLQIALKLNPNVMVQDAQGNWWYVLNVQKQPGLNALPFTLNVHLPEGAEVLEQPEGWSTTSGQVWTWSGNLEESTTIRLGFAENSQGKK